MHAEVGRAAAQAPWVVFLKFTPCVWQVRAMADRIIHMRTLLRQKLESSGSKLKWNHITDQIGMFAYSGMTPEQVSSASALKTVRDVLRLRFVAALCVAAEANFVCTRPNLLFMPQLCKRRSTCWQARTTYTCTLLHSLQCC